MSQMKEEIRVEGGDHGCVGGFLDGSSLFGRGCFFPAPRTVSSFGVFSSEERAKCFSDRESWREPEVPMQRAVSKSCDLAFSSSVWHCVDLPRSPWATM